MKKYFEIERGNILGVTTLIVAIVSVIFVIDSHATGSNAVTFTDIAIGDGAGITYRRGASPSDAINDAIRASGIIHLQDAAFVPANNRGAPGAAILDYDLDGDFDIYVTNGPGNANSLYANQLKQTGNVTFIDVAEEAGVAARDQDSTGVCYGDIDNDGDSDLLVLGAGSSNLLYENQGNGSFKNITVSSSAGGIQKHPGSCSMGDINGDGLLDIAIGNTWDSWDNRLPLMTFQFSDLVEHNQLLLNLGGNHFKDVSDTSGIRGSEARVTWGIALVDYDLDGDADLFTAEDQGPRLPARSGGADMGYIRVYNNDGAGKFTELTTSLGLDQFGGWMSLSFGDINHDGYMDFFASNVGDYSSFATAPMIGFEKVKGEWGSHWFLGDSEGGLTRADTGAVGATVFGWGAAITDYDNDGDSDIVYHGGLDFVFFQDGSNPGVVLNNDGYGNFNRDRMALANSTNHTRRNVRGVSVGDLDDNGFVDFVSVSNQNWPAYAPLIPYPDVPIGGQFDDTAFMWPTFSPIDPTDMSQGFIWNGIEEENGTLSVELNNGENGNNFVKVSVKGSIRLTHLGQVNRSGIGAVVSFTPKGGKPAMRPFSGGSSYASQHSHEWIFGLGQEKKGTLEVLWPGGVRNKLYNVRAGENVLLPEIPCSYDDKSMKRHEYVDCVETSLDELEETGVLTEKQAHRFLASAKKAYGREHASHDDRE